jgi:GlpG protein
MKNQFAPQDSFFDSKPFRAPLTTVACAVCVMIFVALNMASEADFGGVAANLGYLPDRVIWEGKPWVLITSVFVHLEIWHILFNIYWLWILGSCLEESIGSVRWLLFFVGAAWVSSSAELLLGGNSGIGMSGVVYALFGFGWIARGRLPEFGAWCTTKP